MPLSLQPGESKRIRLLLSWYMPDTDLAMDVPQENRERGSYPEFHKPWYAGRFSSIEEVANYWQQNYDSLQQESAKFRDCFFDNTMPAEIVEAAAANLSIMKSPTLLRQTDGRLWGWEGVNDKTGSCHGTCTHVYNYAQAIPHLFPALERGVRATEFNEGQDERGHQNFRVPIPIQPAHHGFHAASDGQLGGIMKLYRDWRISGDTAWMKAQWPKAKLSLHYCMNVWDPGQQGILAEPHHNTYDIEFWGPDGMCTSVYLGALAAAMRLAMECGEATELYEQLYARGKAYLEEELFNGEYFEQKIIWKGLQDQVYLPDYTPEALQLLEAEGPKYQYGSGCLSDGIIGAWFAEMCGLGEIIDTAKVRSHLRSVYKYNLRHDLSSHANPQRPGYALGKEGGLLLCTWPRGGKLSLPFVYSNEVWTGIEYQVASHMLLLGDKEQALDIVRVCRDRYDGTVRNPYNEYECGNWYARAMASYGLLQGWSGARYDAFEQVLYLSARPGTDYRSFLSFDGGYATVGLCEGKPFIEVKSGAIQVDQIVVTD